jgi:Rps23 Pro-64 3,4-dihydroxylase Tpa1-like proline 4-hydroxylase
MRKEYLKKEIMDKDIFKFIHERYINFDSINKIPTNNLTNTQEISLTLLKNNIIFHEFFPLIITDTLLILVFEKRIANTDKEHLIAILPGFSSKIFDDLFKTYKENNGQKINLIFGNFHISFLKYKNEEYLFTHKEILDKESVKFLLNNFLR